LEPFLLWGSAIIVELAATFFMLKYYRKLPNPLGFISKRLESYGKRVADDYMSSILKDLQEHPEIAANLMKKPLELLLTDLAKNPPKALSDTVGQLESTGNVLLDVGQLILPFFGKKGQMAARALPLLTSLKKGTQSNASGKHPFDG
jgi:hypothetical protein